MLPDEGYRYLDTVYDDALAARAAGHAAGRRGGRRRSTVDGPARPDRAVGRRIAWGRRSPADVLAAHSARARRA